MKNIKTLGISLAIFLFFLSSCDDALDINKDPSYPSDAEPQLLLPSGIAFSAAAIGGNFQLIGGFWSQHYTQNNTSNQYTGVDDYGLNISDYNRDWTNIWAGGLKDLKLVMQKSAESGRWDYYMAASIMSAFDYHILVDFYGQLPYSEGLQGDSIPQPVWEEGKEVNNLIIAQLDDAIARADEALALPEGMGNEDYLFQGDIEQWVKFAKTLKLKILMRDFSANQAAIQSLLNEGGFLEEQDAKMDVFEDQENKSNPLFENDRRKLNTANNIKASKTLLSYLQAHKDPRIADFFETNVNGDYVGLAQGNYNADSEALPTNATSRAKLAATDPVYFMSAAESAFLQAEAWARLGDAGKAKTFYDQGVTLAFERWGREAASFIKAGGDYEFKSGSLDQMLESIIIQKWVAATRAQAWDSFFDQNRTGYPKISAVGPENPAYIPGQLTVSITSVLIEGETPRRMLFPKVSSDFNPNTPEVLSINEEMWWHK